MKQPLLKLETHFSPEWSALEKAAFEKQPQYLGHELLCPEPGSWIPSPRDPAWTLARQADGSVRAISNICPHRGALLCAGPGKGAIVCPLHQWSYACDGGAVGFQPDKAPLEGFKPYNFLGLLFDRDPLPAGKPGADILAQFDFDGYKLSGVSEKVYPMNWKSFMEMHLDLAHIAGAHPGLASMVDSNAYESGGLRQGDGWCWQAMRGAAGGLAASPSEAFRNYGAALERLRGGEAETGASWLTLYPMLMIEKNPECLMVSFLEPQGPGLTRNRVEFYYTEEALAFEPELAKWHQAAYEETAREDLALCQRLEAGRRIGARSGGEDNGAIDPLMEAGLPSLHRWVGERVEQQRAG